MRKRLPFIIAIALVSPAAAQSDLRFGELAAGGTACVAPGQVSLEQTAQTLTLVFTSFNAEVSGGAVSVSARPTCNVGIPLEVPNGVSIAVAGSGYRFDVRLNPGSATTVSLETFLAGNRGPVLTRTMVGPVSGTFIGAQTVPPAERQWSDCGADVILRANTSLRLSSDVGTIVPSTGHLELVRIKVLTRRC